MATFLAELDGVFAYISLILYLRFHLQIKNGIPKNRMFIKMVIMYLKTVVLI